MDTWWSPCVTAFNELVYQYPIRIPERFSLVIRSLLTQEGICMTLQPDFRFLEVAYPYVAKRRGVVYSHHHDHAPHTRLLCFVVHDQRKKHDFPLVDQALS